MIYLISHYYPPGSNPPANRFRLLARVLVERYGADQVRVITGRPNHPDGILPQEYHWRWFKKGRGPSGEHVRHLYEYPAANKGVFKKTLGFFSFGCSVGLYFMFKRIRKGDVIVVTSPPTFASYALFVLSFFRPRLRFIFDVRDLMPQILAGMGIMSEGSRIYRLLLGMSFATYRRARLLVGNSPGICDYVSPFQNGREIHLIYNAVEMDQFQPPSEPERRQFRLEHADVLGPEDCTVFLFAGSLSVYMGLKSVVEGFQRLARERQDWRFVIIGYGEEEANLKAQVDAAGLKDLIHFLPYQKREEMIRWLGAADILCSSRTGQPQFDFVVPTKIIEYLAMERFMLTAHASPFVEEVARKGFARNVTPEDPDAWFQAARDLLEHPPGPAGAARAWAADEFSEAAFARRYLHVVDGILSPVA